MSNDTSICDECRHVIGEHHPSLVNADHALACSLYPANIARASSRSDYSLYSYYECSRCHASHTVENEHAELDRQCSDCRIVMSVCEVETNGPFRPKLIPLKQQA